MSEQNSQPVSVFLSTLQNVTVQTCLVCLMSFLYLACCSLSPLLLGGDGTYLSAISKEGEFLVKCFTPSTSLLHTSQIKKQPVWT